MAVQSNLFFLPNKSMKKHGFSIKIHPAGAAALAASILILDSRQILASFLALVLHEGAHLLVMRLCGINDCFIEITPFGGMADARSFEQQPSIKRILCAGAGVLGSLLAAFACFRFAPRNVFWKMFFQANWMLAAFNVLPAWPLDGARVIAAFFSCFGFENAARKVLSVLTLFLGLSMVASGLYGIWHGVFNLSLLITGPYLWYAARLEDITARVRQLNRRRDKFKDGSIMPALIWIGTMENEKRDIAVLLGRMQPSRYHLLMQINPQDGSIHKVWTENEMSDYLFGDYQK